MQPPSGFRPLHIQAAVEAGKHIFAEKPVAVDSAGVQAVLAASEKARDKGLLLFVALQTRYEPTTQEMVARVQDGAIGDLRTMRTTRYGGQVWIRPRKPGMTDVEYQVDNCYQFTWVSGKQVSWQDKLDSNESLVEMGDLTRESELPQWKIAMPGIHGIV